MKKLFVTALIASMAITTAAHAGLELGGNVTAVTAFTYTNDANALNAGQTGQTDLGFTNATGTEFGFVLDQVELDLDSELGQNIRARADIDFRDVTGGSAIRTGDTVSVEQAYVTANIGNNVEFLVGKFNAPLGLESNDRIENAFSAYTPAYTYLNPKSVMGLKFYYEFTDTWSLDFAVVNSLNSTGVTAVNTGVAGASKATDMPSGILRIGAVWGDEGRESFANLGFGFGPENASNKYDIYANLWGSWAFGDYWDLAWEVVYRNSNSGAAANVQGLAAQLAAVWQASEAWDVQLRANWYGELKTTLDTASTNATTTFSNLGAKGNTFGGALGATYHITEGANVKLEYHFDYAKVGATKEDYHAVVAEFGYSF